MNKRISSMKELTNTEEKGDSGFRRKFMKKTIESING